MIDRVERLVLNIRQIKVAELASECGISNGSVYTIIHEHLGMSKVSARWVPRNLNMQDCQQSVESSQELLEVYNVHPEDFYTHLVFVCVAVLQPSQPNGVMSSAVSLPSHKFTGQA